VPLKIQALFKARTDRFPAGIIYKREHQDSLNKQLKPLGFFSIRGLSLKCQTITTDSSTPNNQAPGRVAVGCWPRSAAPGHRPAPPPFCPSRQVLEPQGMPRVRGGDPGSQIFHYSPWNAFQCGSTCLSVQNLKGSEGLH